MGLKQIAPPASEPLSLSEVKLHLRLDEETEDALVTSLIRAAREHVEAMTRRALVPQTWALVLDEWPMGELRLPLPPLRAVSGITYRTDDGTVSTVEPTTYLVDLDSAVGRVVLNAGRAWPGARLSPVNGVRVRFEAGYDTVPEAVKQAMLLIIGHWFQNREAVNVGNIVNTMPFAVEALLWPLKVW